MNENCIHEEINVKLKEGNLYNYSSKNVLSSRLFSKGLKIKIRKTIFPVVLYGSEETSLTLI